MKPDKTERTDTMKTPAQRQAGKKESEAPGLPIRPVSHGQRRLARTLAEHIGGQRTYQRKTAQTIRAALAVFGGRITRVESPALQAGTQEAQP